MARRSKRTPPTEDHIWTKQPEVIKAFLAQRSGYEQLCAEVAYILRKRLDEWDVEYAAVTFRAKTLKSFLEKFIRKNYKEPFEEITDFAGVRVVCLYRSDIAQIEEIVREEFEVIEKVDKLAEQGADRFGYGATHFIVKLGPKSSGARYDDLKDLVCELQTRTVLQDAWAIVDHHLVYKREAEIPTKLKRSLNSLVGVFETADDQFDSLRDQRAAYLEEIEAKRAGGDEFLAQEVDLETLTAYCNWKVPDLNVDTQDLGNTIQLMNKAKFPTLQEIDDAYEEHKEAIEVDRTERLSTWNYGDQATPVIDMAVMLADPSYMAAGIFAQKLRAAMKKRKA